MNNHKIVENYRNPILNFEKVCTANNGTIKSATNRKLNYSGDTVGDLKVCVSGNVPTNLYHNLTNDGNWHRWVCLDTNCNSKFELKSENEFAFPMITNNTSNYLPFRIYNDNGTTNIDKTGDMNSISCGMMEFNCPSNQPVFNSTTFQCNDTSSSGTSVDPGCNNSNSCKYDATKKWCVPK